MCIHIYNIYIHIISIYNIYNITNITELICQIHSNHEPWSWQSWCFHHFSQALVLQDLDSVVDGRHHQGSRDRWDLAGPEVRRRRLRRHRVPWRSGGSGAQGREERIDLPWETPKSRKILRCRKSMKVCRISRYLWRSYKVDQIWLQFHACCEIGKEPSILESRSLVHVHVF